ncbi:tetratricopeptide repeat protein [Fulvivirgaceae bacterium BMA10]|uniref:Tetratricopeptide repeat protein n=1 Tax=Splendidivirga corallicola TaxID=3051826 RepID=A0ABT8KJK0_9BACT|nr:tetratricopeptide repeat protein [Fulvivirgaceae bacterium BMA10]
MKRVFVFCVLLSTFLPENVQSQIKIDSLQEALQRASSPRHRLELLISLAEQDRQLSATDIIAYGKKALELAQRLGDKHNEARALLSISIGYEHFSNYDESLENLLAALKLFEELKDANGRSNALNNLGYIYWRQRDFTRALEYLKSSYEICEEAKNQTGMSDALNLMGLIYMGMTQFDTALNFFQHSLAIEETLQNKEGIARAYNNIGILYNDQQDYTNALPYYEQSLQLNTELDRKWAIIEALNNIGVLYVHTGDFTRAQEHLMKAHDRLEELKDRNLLKDNYEYLSMLYERSGNQKNALDYYKKRDSLILLQKDRNISDIRNIYYLEKQENEIALMNKEIELLEQQKETNRIKQRAVVIGLILALVIAILIVGRLRSSIRKNKKIFEAKQALSNAKLKNEELEMSRLKDKLEYKNQELINFALHIAQKNDIYYNLSESLQELDFMNKEDASQKIKKLIGNFNHRLKINQDLENFQADVENVNKDFFFRLHDKFPQLTETEKRLVAQLRLNLSSKEISSLNSISVKSVEISRYRLRKKFNLDSSENLTEFIQNL